MTTTTRFVPTPSTRGSLSILVRYRVFARWGSRHRLLERDETTLQRYYEGLQLDPQGWGIRLQVADVWAQDQDPLYQGTDQNHLWYSFKRALDDMDVNPTVWGLRYPELRGTLGW